MTDPNTPSNPEEQNAAQAAADATTPAAPATPASEVPAAPAAETPAYSAPAAPATPAPGTPAAGPYTSGAPAAPAANPYAAPAAGYAAAGPVKQTLSLISFIAGLVGILLGFIGWGLLFSIAAVVLGFMGKKREPQAPKWMWLTGLITGWVGIALNVIVFVFVVIVPLIFLASLGSLSSY